MNIYEITFSPTGGTKKVAGILANELGQNITAIDLSNGSVDFYQFSLTHEDIAIIAVPSYSGRVPSIAAERMAKIQGNGAKAIIVCVYGNRAYEDTLVELQDIVQQAGFSVVSAIAAIAEHSIAHKYATNRPDKDDYEHLRAFAGKIGKKLAENDFSIPAIPGNRPYRKAAGAGIVPKATKACTQCSLCASRCPVGAIDEKATTETDSSLCIGCNRCIYYCPKKARSLNPEKLATLEEKVGAALSGRKESELYI